MKIKTNGDAIAHEFLKLMGSKPTLNKQAQQQEVTGGDTTVTLEDSAMDDSLNDDEVADLVTSGSNDSDDNLMSQLNDSLNEVGLGDATDDYADDYADDDLNDGLYDESNSLHNKEASLLSPKGIKVMHGLGKIAASLRTKGENFAADVVEATAMSIGNDLKKEASEKKAVVSNLSKIASDLDHSGDKFAGDLVRATINNIIKK